LARRLGPDQPFYGFQTPLYGLQTPHQWQALRTIEEMAASYLALIQTVQPQGPYLLGGWSFGGLVALEMAQQLQRQGDEVGLLAILDSYLTNAQWRAKVMQKEIDLGDAGMVKELIRHFEITVPDDFDQRELDAQLSYAVEQAKKMHLFPVDVSLDFVRHSHRTWTMNQYAAHMYVPQSYPYQIDYFAASDSLERKVHLDEEEVSAEVAVPRDHLQHWREVTLGEMQVHVIPGHHLNIIEEPNVQVLANTLRSCIDRVCDRLAHGKK
jgi:thioesterase domain-containing protein